MTEVKTAALLGAALLLYSAGAPAELTPVDGTGQGILDQVVAEFSTRAAAWTGVVMGAASRLFWTLATISLAWTFGFMALRKADLGEFFAEFARFTVFTGFFYWVLQNGPAFADSIILSLRQIGDSAAGTTGLSPSSIVDVGFRILKQAWDNLQFSIDSLIGALLSVGILLLLAVVAINILLLQIAGWILMYAGIFFLGFGGSRWTSDMAINYYRTVLGTGVQLFVMTLLVGIGQDLLTGFYAQMSHGPLSGAELGVMLVFCVALLVLANKVPAMVAGVATGGGGASGIGTVGAGAVAGAAMGAAGMAMAAASMGGSMLARGAVETAGGASALMAAFASGEKNASSEPSSLGGGDTPGLGDGSKGGSGRQMLMQGARAVLAESVGKAAESVGGAVAGSFGGRVAASIKAARAAEKEQAEKQKETPTAAPSGGEASGPAGEGGATQTPSGAAGSGTKDSAGPAPGGDGQGAAEGSQPAEPAFSADSLGAGREAGNDADFEGDRGPQGPGGAAFAAENLGAGTAAGNDADFDGDRGPQGPGAAADLGAGREASNDAGAWDSTIAEFVRKGA